MSHIEHDVVGSPVLNEGVELIYQILRLLARKARYREISVKALAGRSMAIFTISELGLHATGRFGAVSTGRDE
jgi:hypothetical protein